MTGVNEGMEWSRGQRSGQRGNLQWANGSDSWVRASKAEFQQWQGWSQSHCFLPAWAGGLFMDSESVLPYCLVVLHLWVLDVNAFEFLWKSSVHSHELGYLLRAHTQPINSPTSWDCPIPILESQHSSPALVGIIQSWHWSHCLPIYRCPRAVVVSLWHAGHSGHSETLLLRCESSCPSSQSSGNICVFLNLNLSTQV